MTENQDKKCNHNGRCSVCGSHSNELTNLRLYFESDRVKACPNCRVSMAEVAALIRSAAGRARLESEEAKRRDPEPPDVGPLAPDAASVGFWWAKCPGRGWECVEVAYLDFMMAGSDHSYSIYSPGVEWGGRVAGPRVLKIPALTPTPKAF